MDDFDEIEIINEFDEDDEREDEYKPSSYVRHDYTNAKPVSSKLPSSNERSDRYLVIYDEDGDSSSNDKDDEDYGWLYLHDSDKSRLHKGDKSNVLDDDYYHQEVKKLDQMKSSKHFNTNVSKAEDSVDDITAGVKDIGINKYPISQNKEKEEEEQEEDDFVEVKSKDRYEEKDNKSVRRMRSGSRELQVAKKFKELEEHVQKLGSPISNLGNNLAKMSEYVDGLESSSRTSNTRTRHKSSIYGRKNAFNYGNDDDNHNKDPWLHSDKKHDAKSRAERRNKEVEIERSFIGEYEPSGRSKNDKDEELLEYRQVSDIPLVSSRYEKRSDVRSEMQLLREAMDESDEILKQYGRSSKINIERPSYHFHRRRHHHQEEEDNEEEKEDHDDDKVSASGQSKLSLLKKNEQANQSRRGHRGSSGEYGSKIDRELAKINLENIKLHEKHLQEQITETRRKAESFLKAISALDSLSSPKKSKRYGNEINSNRKARQSETKIGKSKYEDDAEKQKSPSQNEFYDPQQLSSRMGKKKDDQINEMQSNRKKTISNDVEKGGHESIFSSRKPLKMSTPSEKYTDVFEPRIPHADRTTSKLAVKEVEIRDQTRLRDASASTRAIRHQIPHVNQTTTSMEALGSLSPERSSRIEKSSRKPSTTNNTMHKALISPERAREAEDIFYEHRDHGNGRARSSSLSRIKRRDPSPSLRPLPTISSPASNYLKPTQSTLAKKIDRAGYVPTTVSAASASPRQTIPFLLGKSLAPSYSIYSGPYAPLDPVGDYFKVDKKIPLHSKNA